MPPLSILFLSMSITPMTLAFWRMPCRSRTGLARIDPIMSPGVASRHVHAIHGGGNFKLQTSYRDLRASVCTSCAVSHDKSAYWIPPLYFVYSNGTVEIVPQLGGMVIYYFLHGQDVQAFPANFKMLAGNTNRRNFTLPVPDPPTSFWQKEDMTQQALAQKAIGFNCLNAKNPEPTLSRHSLPTKEYIDANCIEGIRTELMFPSCWNGKTDAIEKEPHLQYPSLVMDGECAEGFRTRVPALLYEAVWDTYRYKGIEGGFLLGNGDSSGYGFHGDFMNGWEVDFLKRAISTCTNRSGRVEDCPLFIPLIQTDEEAVKCVIEVPEELRNETCIGPRKGLCGVVED